MDFSESCWEHIRVDSTLSDAEGTDSKAVQPEKEPQNLDALCTQIDSISEDIKKRLGEESFTNSMKKFVATYHKLSSKPSNASLISSLHKFGWCYSGTVTSLKSGILWRGRRIPIQARSAGRRKGSAKRGKAAIIAGRCPKAACKPTEEKEILKYFLPGKAHNN